MVNVSKNYSHQKRNGDGKEEGRTKEERKEKGTRTGEQVHWEKLDIPFIQVMASDQVKIGELVVRSF